MTLRHTCGLVTPLHKTSQWLPMALWTKATILTRQRPLSTCLWVQATQSMFLHAPNSPPASGPLHMPYFQAGISSLPPSTPKCSPVFQVPFLGKSGQGPPNPCPFGSRDFCSQDVSQFVVGIYDSPLFECSVSSNGPSPPSTLLTMVSLGIGTVWGTETLNI